MKNGIVTIALIAFVLSVGCSRNSNFKADYVLNIAILQPGDVYSVAGEHDYGVVKVLAVDPDVVHLRLYKNRFPQRPKTVKLNTLTIGTVDDMDGPGVGHAPISKAAFEKWQPVLVTRTKLTADELEGYNLWKRTAGK